VPDHGVAGPTPRYTLIVTMLMCLTTVPTAVVVGAGRAAVSGGPPRTRPLIAAGRHPPVEVVPADRAPSRASRQRARPPGPAAGGSAPARRPLVDPQDPAGTGAVGGRGGRARGAPGGGLPAGASPATRPAPPPAPRPAPPPAGDPGPQRRRPIGGPPWAAADGAPLALVNPQGAAAAGTG
jgi:hypothetical protein